jgi:hypothetical protein
VGLDEETVCGDDAECAGAMRPGQTSTTQYIHADSARPRWCRSFIGCILPISRTLAQPVFSISRMLKKSASAKKVEVQAKVEIKRV